MSDDIEAFVMFNKLKLWDRSEIYNSGSKINQDWKGDRSIIVNVGRVLERLPEDHIRRLGIINVGRVLEKTARKTKWD